jgi:putative ABC transport system permease protein
MTEEMRLHLDLQTEKNIAAGMNPIEARYAARRQFGGVEQIKEQCREQRGIWFNDALGDLRYGLRQLRKAPGFATVAILTLAIGIGATTAIFSIVNSVLLRPLDYPDSDQLVALRETFPPDNRPGPVSWASYYRWADRAVSFSNLAASRFGSGNLIGAGDSERVSTLQVTMNYLTTLGVQPMIGRGFLPEEAIAGHGNVMVITHWYWLKKFDGAADVLDRKVQFNDQAFTIVGVLPQNAQLDTMSPVFVPLIATAADRENHSVTRDSSADVVGRLKPGISTTEAASELEVLASAMAAEFPATNKGRGAAITSLLEQTVASTAGYGMNGASSLLLLLLGAVGFLLVIACVNVANLLLARASARRKEIAMRAALGASRFRILRQLLCESLLLAVLGGSIGALFAYWGLDLLKPLTGNLPRANEISLDGRTLLFSLIITLLTGIGFGVVPAWHAMQMDVLDGLKEGGQANEGRRSRRSHSTLIVVEVALALMLLTGAGLLIKSFIRLQQVELGFQTEGIYANRLELPAKKYGTPQRQVAFVEQVTERISGLPNVSSAAFTTGMPVFGSLGGAFKIAGHPEDPEEQMQGMLCAATTPEYFNTIGLPMIRGRSFAAYDVVNAPRVAIISASVAKRYFPNQDPIGQRICRLTPSAERAIWLEIVGVVGDVKQWGPASDTMREQPGNVYEPFAQNPTVLNLLLVVRTNSSQTDLPSVLRSVIQSVDTDMPLTRMFRLADGVNESIGRFRLSMSILALFAGIALLLAVIGVYGVTAYAVTQRTHEIGVRMAIGAQRRDILRLVFSQAGKLIGIGLFIGVAGSLIGTRLLRALLFEVSPQDPATLGAVAVVLIGATLLACWWPARRAAKVDPMVALRSE